MSAVRIGFVGLGIIAEAHLAVLAGMPEADLVFTVDPRTDRPPPRFREAAVPHFAGLAARNRLARATGNVDGIERVDIHHDRANVRSRGVPARPGFTFLGESPDGTPAP